MTFLDYLNQVPFMICTYNFHRTKASNINYFPEKSENYKSAIAQAEGKNKSILSINILSSVKIQEMSITKAAIICR